MDVIKIFFYITSIVFMFIFSFIGIWGFISFIKMQKHLKYQNQLTEKLNQNLSNLSRINSINSNALKEIASKLKEDQDSNNDDKVNESLLNITNELVDINNNKKVDMRKI